MDKHIKKYLREKYAFNNIKEIYSIFANELKNTKNKSDKAYELLFKEDKKEQTKQKTEKWVKKITENIKEKKTKQKQDILYKNEIIINNQTIQNGVNRLINRIELNNVKRKFKKNKEPLLFQQTIEFYGENGKKLKSFMYLTGDDMGAMKNKTFETNNITDEFIYKIEMYMTAGVTEGIWIPDLLSNEGGYTKIITKVMKNIKPKKTQQIFKDADTGTCVYDGCVKYFENKKDTNKNAKSIYNQLLKNKNTMAKAYTEEEIDKKLAPFCKSSISIQNLITGKNKTFNENSNNRFNIEFMNTKHNHLDLMTHSYNEPIEVDNDEYNNIKYNSKFWIEKYGQLITLDKIYTKKKNEFTEIYNDWKYSVDYHNKFIYQDSKAYEFISSTYDYKLHTFFNKMEIDNDLYTELDLKKAYLNYSDDIYNNFYCGVPSGSFINVKCNENFGEDAFNEITDNGLVGYYQIKMLDNNLDKRLGFTEGSVHTLYTSMIKLLLDNGEDFIFLNACYSPSVDINFNEQMIKKDENGLKHYCKAFGLMMSENSTIDIKIKPLKCDLKYFNTFENDENINLFKDDNIVKIQYKNKRAKSYIHIAYAIHAYTQTIILEQLLKMDLDKVFGVKLDSIVITKEYSEELKTRRKGIYNNFRFEKKDCKIEGLLKEGDEVFNEGEEDVVDGFYRNYIISKSQEYEGFELPFTQNGEYIENRIVLIGGKGGSGKTFSIMKALEHNCYTTMCWNLIQDKYNFVGHSIPQLIGSNLTDEENNNNFFKCEITKDNSFKYIIIDEATLIHKNSIKKICETYTDYFIFILGDIDRDGYYYQSSIHRDSIINPMEENYQYIEYTKSYRFDENLNNKLNGLRKKMRMWNSNGYEYVKKHFSNCFYNKEDVIMNDNDVGITALDDLKRGSEWTNYFINKGTKPKYFIKKTNINNGQMRGQQLDEKPSHSNYECKLFKTIHSFQGLDLNHDNKIIIVLNSLFDKNLLYTALSRARREDQIIIISTI